MNVRDEMAQLSYLTPAQVAAELGYKSVKTVRRNLRALYRYASPRHPLIRRADLDAWLAKQKRAA